MLSFELQGTVVKTHPGSLNYGHVIVHLFSRVTSKFAMCGMACHAESSGAMVRSPDCKCSNIAYCFQFDVVYFLLVYSKKPPAMSWLKTCNHLLHHGISARAM